MKFRARVVGALVCALVLSITPAASAEKLKVTTKDDELDASCAPNDCSIREALQAAAASTEKDKIKVPKGKYVLSAGPLELSSELKMVGAGAQKTIIDADGTSRVMDVGGGPTTLSKLRITGGNALVANGGDFPGDGGGILAIASGKITLSQVAVVGNTAQMGGGGLNAPVESSSATNIVVKRSLFAKNKVTGGAGDGMGGGLAVSGNLSLTNSTVAKNRVENAVTTNRGGGISMLLNTTTGVSNLTLQNATIAKNAIAGDAIDGIGGGIGLSDPLMGASANIEATNSVVTQNKVVGSVENCGMVTTGVTSTANLSSDDTCLFDDNKSITGKNAKLGKLKLNGGQTETMKPKSSSPVVDKGVDNGCKSPDQRGVKRPQGKRCDMGAVEVKK